MKAQRKSKQKSQQRTQASPQRQTTRARHAEADRHDAPVAASHDAPAARDRRSADRLPDGQRSGQGSAQALSRLQMLERRWSWIAHVQNKGRW